MTDPSAARIEFAASFVDSVTINPFLDDLRRMRKAARVFRSLPRRATDPFEPAHDAPAAA